MSRNEETSSARRADGRRDAGPGRASWPVDAGGKKPRCVPGKPSDDRKSGGDSPRRREEAEQNGRRKAAGSVAGERRL